MHDYFVLSDFCDLTGIFCEIRAETCCKPLVTLRFHKVPKCFRSAETRIFIQ